VSVLLRQPQRFEGFGAIDEIVLPHHQASAQSEELKEVLIHGDTASLSLHGQLDRGQNAISEVEELLWGEANVEGFEELSPKSAVALVAMEDRTDVREGMCRVKLDVGINACDEQFDVASVPRRSCPLSTTHEHRATQAGAVGQPGPPRQQEAAKRRKANDDPFVHRPMLPRIGYGRDSDTPNHLHVLLRHRPLSIPQEQSKSPGEPGLCRGYERAVLPCQRTIGKFQRYPLAVVPITI
jgi:hypothetical protein